MAKEKTLPEEGWGEAFRSRKWHYYAKDGRALCGKFRLVKSVPLEQGNDDSPDNCAGCMKSLKKTRGIVREA